MSGKMSEDLEERTYVPESETYVGNFKLKPKITPRKSETLYLFREVSNRTAPATFEEAANLTGFGKFNIILFCLVIFGIFSHMFENITVSYILAAAQCDLNLSLQQKGYLTSIVFAGMISGSFFWGFIMDIYGRRKMMMIGYLLNACSNLIGGLSQSFGMLLFSKFCGGFVISGPFTAMSAYLSEFHSSKYRNRVQLINGTLASLAQVVVPLLAWGILPLSIELSFFDGNIELHSWNVFLLVTGLCPLTGGIIFIFLPESPKFLMTSGNNDKAMEVLKTVYSWNTGNPPDMFPVKMLVEEKPKIDTDKKNAVEDLKNGISTIFSVFKPPYLWKILVITLSLTTCLCSLQSLRLWMPQLFQSLEDYKSMHQGNISDICTMLGGLQVERTVGGCSTDVTKTMVYINTMIGAVFQVVFYILTGCIINLLGKKKVLLILPNIAVAGVIGLLYIPGTAYTTTFTGIFIACGHVAAYVYMSVIVDVFPTNLRATTLGISLAIGRLAVVLGNALFPILFKYSCSLTFIIVGGSMAVCGILNFLLPDTENKALQ